jgi:uncharacterized membrane protein YccF (DUF307 family)
MKQERKHKIFWIVLGGGGISFLQYVVIGALLCVTLIGIPFGVQSFKLAWLALTPFDREVTPVTGPVGVLSVVGNVIWILLGGFQLALVHLLLATLNAITVIGIPNARQHLKLAMLALLPFGQAIPNRAGQPG